VKARKKKANAKVNDQVKDVRVIRTIPLSVISNRGRTVSSFPLPDLMRLVQAEIAMHGAQAQVNNFKAEFVDHYLRLGATALELMMEISLALPGQDNDTFKLMMETSILQMDHALAVLAGQHNRKWKSLVLSDEEEVTNAPPSPTPR
jgi:hypothetical protein